MSPKLFLGISGTLFAVIAMAQLIRALSGLQVLAGTFEVPLWASWVAAAVAGYLAVSAFILLRK